MVSVKDPLAADRVSTAEAIIPRKPRQAIKKTRSENAAAHAAATTDDPLMKDFRLFVVLLWRHLLGVDPTPVVLDMAWWLQHGPERMGIMAFRGAAKSWVTGAYALWLLYCDPQKKVLVVSGSLTKSVQTTNWCLMLIMSWDKLAFLRPRTDQRSSSKAFDVGPAEPDPTPSFMALGLGGQATGNRSDCIIPDDVETQTNSRTVTERDKNKETVKEYDSILKPGGTIKYLGTPHDEDSLYSELPKRGYVFRIWPAIYPTEEQVKGYGSRLAPWVLQRLRKDPSLVGTPTMPERFTADDLAKRLLSLGSSEFALQFMLDTTLSDRDKYPLKVGDLMVMSCDPRRAPDHVSWSNDASQRLTELPVMGFEGDYYHAPVISPDASRRPYTRIVGAIDSSGRGKDETGFAIIGELNGILYLIHLYASLKGYDLETLQAIAKAIVQFRVNKLRIEANFGDGMFAALFRPVLQRTIDDYRKKTSKVSRFGGLVAPDDEYHGCEIEEVRSSNMVAKEKRILSVMEPVTQQHRLVIDTRVLLHDFKSLENIEGEDTRHRYAFGHQYSHLTRDRDSLAHDDRLETVALAIGDFADILGVDPEIQAKVIREDAMEEELERLFGDGEDDEHGVPRPGDRSGRARGLRPTPR